MTASNTQDCFRVCIGKTVRGVLFNALPDGRDELAAGTKTLVFDDGTGLTISARGTFWIDSPEDVTRAIARKKMELASVQKEIGEVLAAAGAQ